MKNTIIMKMWCKGELINQHSDNQKGVWSNPFDTIPPKGSIITYTTFNQGDKEGQGVKTTYIVKQLRFDTEENYNNTFHQKVCHIYVRFAHAELTELSPNLQKEANRLCIQYATELKESFWCRLRTKESKTEFYQAVDQYNQKLFNQFGIPLTINRCFRKTDDGNIYFNRDFFEREN